MSSLQRRFLPPFVLFLFAGHLLLMLIKPDYALGDPGTPWHFKWGQLLVSEMTLPRYDHFSHTMPGGQWINYQWLFQALTGVTQLIGGVPFTTALLTLVYASVPCLLYQRMLREGCNAFIALFMGGMAWFIMTLHALARPHVFSYLFFALLLERLYALYEGKTTLRRSAWLIPMMMVWTNLHGGFSVGLLLIGIVFLVALGRWFFAWRNGADAEWRLRLRDLFLCGFLGGLATLINPYGIHLHLHVLSFLNLEVLAQWSEFATPDFFSPSGNVRGFEILMLMTIAVFFAFGRTKSVSVLDLVLFIVFLHFALQSIRHVVLFTIVATPIAARGLSRAAATFRRSVVVRRGHVLTAQQLSLQSGRLYLPLLGVAYLLLSLIPSPFFRDGFLGIYLSNESAAFIQSHPDRFQRPFNTDQMGGAIIYHLSPAVPVFADDRADFYWQDFMKEKFFPVRFGKSKWAEVLKEYRVDSLILPVDNALEPMLALTDEWKLVHEDDLNKLYWRSHPDQLPATE